MNRKHPRGFTLIELLVVIAVIGVLLAILVSVFATAPEKARRMSCLSNEKQLGIAFAQYEQESDERYPNGTVKRTGWDPPSETPPSGEGWAGQIYPYVKSVAAFECPDDPAPSAPSVPPATKISYGYNNWLTAPADVSTLPGCVLSTPKTVLLFETTGNAAQITLPDEGTAQGAHQFSAAGDGGLLISNPGGTGPALYATGWMGRFDSEPSSYQQFPERGGRHGGGANYLLTDGHVKWLLPERVLSAIHPRLSGADFQGYDAYFENQNYRPK